jgi:hypothetical protein
MSEPATAKDVLEVAHRLANRSLGQKEHTSNSARSSYPSAAGTSSQPGTWVSTEAAAEALLPNATDKSFCKVAPHPAPSLLSSATTPADWHSSGDLEELIALLSGGTLRLTSSAQVGRKSPTGGGMSRVVHVHPEG